MEKRLIIVRNTLLGVAFMGIAAGAIQGVTEAKAKSNEPIFSSATTVDLTGSAISLDEFMSKTDIINRLSTFAALDDVDKERTCDNMTGMGNFLVTGFDAKSERATSDQKTAMLYNTWFLQQLIYCASETNGSARTTLKLPEGTFYFVSGHLYAGDGSQIVERHVIKPHNHIVLTGAGTEIDSKQTVLKPYSEKSEFTGVDGGLDMFFFNDYAAYGFPSNPNYLKDVHYSNFVVDSAETAGLRYNTSGKGFMINLFEDNTWYNITVQNTDATGFGVDCPIGDSWIDNSRAYGNGKGVWVNATTWSPVGVTRGGGSGFGIGTGYSDKEHFEIRNSIAKGNGIFGFFYEHQDRFGWKYYTATRGDFSVKNSVAEGNTWNFGGLRSNDVTFSNITSTLGQYRQSNGTMINTIRHLHFSDDSRNIALSGITLNGGSAFKDVDSTKWYADAVLWAEKYSITGKAIEINAKANSDQEKMDRSRNDNYATTVFFGVGDDASRADIVAMIWRMMGYPGDTLSDRNGNLSAFSGHVPNLPTCFDDVDPNRSYAAAVGWAANNGIVNGVGGACRIGTAGGAQFFSKTGSGAYSTTTTRAEAMTMLYRLAGSPSVTPVEDFNDVTDKSAWYYNAVQWAVQNKITNGVGENTFAPQETCTREQIVAFLYRYWTQFICKDNCPSIDRLLDIHHNE